MANSDTPLLHLPAEFINLCRERMVLAGFSGGTDSTAMLLLLQEAGVDFTAVHFEHGLRGQESIEDALWAENFAHTHGIPFKRIALSVKAAGSVENNARDARIAAWRELTASDGIFPGAAVVLAHHKDDAVETMLERLARGGNTSALAAMRLRRIVRGVEFFRPLLAISRRELEEYLFSKGIHDCRFDSTNGSCDYFRNHIRNNVLPLWAKGYDFLHGGLWASLRALNRDSEFLETAAAEHWAQRPCREEGRNKLSAEWFSGLAGAMQFRVLGIFFRANNVSETNIASVMKRLESASGGTVPVDCSNEMQMVRGCWKIRKKNLQDHLWHWQTVPQVEFDGDIYSVRVADAPDFAAKDHPSCDTPGRDRVWFPVNILPGTLELSISRHGRTIRRNNCSTPEPVKNFKKPDCVMGIPGDAEVLWLAGVRRSGTYPVTAGEKCAVFERTPRK